MLSAFGAACDEILNEPQGNIFLYFYSLHICLDIAIAASSEEQMLFVLFLFFK